MTTVSRQLSCNPVSPISPGGTRAGPFQNIVQRVRSRRGSKPEQEPRQKRTEQEYNGPWLVLPLQWLNKCVQTHKRCAQKLDPPFQPTRLVDLGLHGRDTVKVVETHSLTEAVKYLTLSYCWGNSMPTTVQTCKQNYQNQQRRIHVAELPKTLRHFLQIARGLGVQYVWIDALCIIQDSQTDWEQQCASMGQIFAHSLCTIAAESSIHCDGGIWLEGGSEEEVPDDPKATWENSSQVEKYRTYQINCDQRICNSALQKRGWAVQEREISPRVLHFTYSHMYWECKSFKADATALLAGKQLESDSARKYARMEWAAYRPRLFDIPRNFDLVSPITVGFVEPESLYSDVSSPINELPLSKHFESWRCLTGDFSTRAFTRPSDRMYALSGLAAAFEPIAQSQYVCGLWKGDLELGLLWQRDAWRKPCIGDSTGHHHAPSWSWASSSQPISYARIHSVFGGDFPQSYYGSIKFRDIRLKPYGLDPRARIAKGYLMLRGYVRWTDPGVPDEEGMAQPMVRYDDLAEEVWDAVENSMRGVLVLHVVSSKRNGAFGLALLPVVEGEQVYRRVGMVEGIEEGWFDLGWSQEVLIL